MSGNVIDSPTATEQHNDTDGLDIFTTPSLDLSIRSYLDNKHSQRALMITGEWGSGKTTNIKEWIRKNTSEYFILRILFKKYRPVVYVSAFGVANSDQLKEIIALKSLSLSPLGIIISAAHIILKIVLAAMGGSLATKIDWFQSWARRPSALVIDDVERVNGSVVEIFGKINEFIEQRNTKVILISDEARLTKKDSEKYLEKIVDRSIRLPVNHRKMADVMISDIFRQKGLWRRFRNIKDKKFLLHIEEVVAAFTDSKTNNYRALSSAIEVAYKIYCVSPAENSHNRPYIRSLIYAVVAYSIEHKIQKLTRSDIDGISNRTGLLSSPSEKDSPLIKYKKYRISSSIFTPVSPELISLAILEGFEDVEKIKNILNSNSLLVPRDMDDWEVVWRRFHSNEENVKAAVVSQQANIDRLSYKDTGIVLHVFANKFSLSEAGLIEDSYTQIVDEAKTYIDRLVQAGGFAFHETASDDNMFIDFSSYKSLGYPNSKYAYYKYFCEVSDYMRQKFSEYFISSHNKHILSTFADIDSNLEECIAIIRSLRGEFFYKDLLHIVPEHDFARQIVSLGAERRSSLGQVFISRISDKSVKRPLEDAWIKKLELSIIKLAKDEEPYKKISALDFCKYCLNPRIS